MKKIFLLNSCNQWKTYSSMSFIMASSSFGKIKKEIIDRIKSGDFEYTRGNIELTKNQQVKLLKEDLKCNDLQFVFDNLDFGFVRVVNDGEVQ